MAFKDLCIYNGVLDYIDCKAGLIHPLLANIGLHNLLETTSNVNDMNTDYLTLLLAWKLSSLAMGDTWPFLFTRIGGYQLVRFRVAVGL